MRWKRMVLDKLPPDTAAFVDEALRRVAATGVCDAPGLIGGVLTQMHVADSDLVRAAAPLAETLMIAAFKPAAREHTLSAVG